MRRQPIETASGSYLKILLSNSLKQTSKYPKSCAEVGSTVSEIGFCTLSLCVQPCHICCRSAFVLKNNISQVGVRVFHSDHTEPERTCSNSKHRFLLRLGACIPLDVVAVARLEHVAPLNMRQIYSSYAHDLQARVLALSWGCQRGIYPRLQEVTFWCGRSAGQSQIGILGGCRVGRRNRNSWTHGEARR